MSDEKRVLTPVRSIRPLWLDFPHFPFYIALIQSNIIGQMTFGLVTGDDESVVIEKQGCLEEYLPPTILEKLKIYQAFSLIDFSHFLEIAQELANATRRQIVIRIDFDYGDEAKVHDTHCFDPT